MQKDTKSRKIVLERYFRFAFCHHYFFTIFLIIFGSIMYHELF